MAEKGTQKFSPMTQNDFKLQRQLKLASKRGKIFYIVIITIIIVPHLDLRRESQFFSVWDFIILLNTYLKLMSKNKNYYLQLHLKIKGRATNS